MDSPASRKLEEERQRKLAEIRVKIEEGDRITRRLADPDLPDFERQTLEARRDACKLTTREESLLARFEEEERSRRLEEILRHVPIEVLEDCIDRHRIAPTQHKIKVFLEKIGFPFSLDKKKKTRSFDLYRLLDWLFGEFIVGRSVAMDSKDETIQMLSLVANPMEREKLQQEYVQAQTEMVRIKISKERRELVPLREVSEIALSQAAVFNRFGERLKTKGYDDLLNDFNEMIEQYGQTFENTLETIIVDSTGSKLRVKEPRKKNK